MLEYMHFKVLKIFACMGIFYCASSMIFFYFKVWQHDKDFLQKLYPFLASVKESEYPVDIFFLDTIPVPPTRYRPVSNKKVVKVIGKL